MSIVVGMIKRELEVVEKNLEIARGIKSKSARKDSTADWSLKRDYLLARQENEKLSAENKALKEEIAGPLTLMIGKLEQENQRLRSALAIVG